MLIAIIWTAHQMRLRRLHHQFEMTLNARVNERTRIARELHDSLLQGAHGLLLRFQIVSELLPGRPLEAKDNVDHAIKQTAEFITEARDQVQGLRESTLQRNDLALSIRTLGDELSTASAGSRPDFNVAVEGEPQDLHPILRDDVYKIAAEALRNAFRHAQARHIEMELRYDNEQFRLRVRDDGRGIDPAILARQGTEGHFGLRGLQERAKLMGAKLEIWSEVDTGTELELVLPANRAYASEQKRSWFSRKFTAKAE
jgi:signal transduction histidine kinase